MNLNIHIERLVLDGLPIEHHQGPLVQAAVEAELSRLLTDNGLAAGLQAGIALPSVNANGIQVAPGNSPAQMGRQIAQSIYGGIGNTR
ncbi:MAG TPA: hypothetical protein VMP08_22335 [Anaerolineae bacterium]|nr:hypothetical protein [Anaerolineae bacterium]